MSEVVFDEATHTYTLGGRVLPSVTAVLQQLVDYSRVPPERLALKRDIGLAVHAAIELDLNGDLDESSIAEPWAGYFAGWRRFRAESGFRPEHWERRMANADLGFAGTVDLVGALHRARAVIDTKTVYAIEPAYVGPQTAAYARLANEPTALRFALHLKPDGTYALVPLNNPQDFLVFLAALKLYQWRQQHGI